MAAIPDRMTAIAVRGGRGPAEALQPVEIATPKPGPGEVLIRIEAAGLNRADILQREGRYPPPPGAPETLGMEAAGTVAALGEGVGRWRPGDRVCALLGGGGYAEYVAVDVGAVLPIPRGLGMVEAAALPEAVITVFANVFEAGALKPGETLLVHGATSGIGVTAIRMAKALGARVITTSRGAEKAETARRFGADVAIDTTAEDFAERVRTEGGADVILDMVGGDYVQKNLAALKPLGRLVNIAYQAGSKVEVDLMPVMLKRLVVTGSTLRARATEEKARLAREVEARVWPWIEAGDVRPVVDRAFPLKDAAAAHAWLEGGAHVGKVVLTV